MAGRGARGGGSGRRWVAAGGRTRVSLSPLAALAPCGAAVSRAGEGHACAEGQCYSSRKRRHHSLPPPRHAPSLPSPPPRSTAYRPHMWLALATGQDVQGGGPEAGGMQARRAHLRVTCSRPSGHTWLAHATSSEKGPSVKDVRNFSRILDAHPRNVHECCPHTVTSPCTSHLFIGT